MPDRIGTTNKIASDPDVVRDMRDPTNPIYRVVMPDGTITVFPGTDAKFAGASCSCGAPAKARHLGLTITRRTCVHIDTVASAIDNYVPEPIEPVKSWGTLFNPEPPERDLARELFGE